MALISAIHEIFPEPGCLDRCGNLRVGLACKPDSQHLPELRILAAFLREGLPESFRIAVCSEKSGMCDVEISVWLHYLPEILLVVSVGNEFHRRGGHCHEIILHERRYGHDHIRIVEHFAFQA